MIIKEFINSYRQKNQLDNQLEKVDFFLMESRQEVLRLPRKDKN